MPLFPEQLYQLSSRDLQVTWLDPFISSITQSSPAAAVTTDIQVPEGRVLILGSALSSAVPGAGQNLTTQFIRIAPPDPATAPVANIAVSQAVLAANIAQVLAFSGALVVPPEWIIRAGGNFNAGVANNVIDLHVVGLLIPVGNIQRV